MYRKKLQPFGTVDIGSGKDLKDNVGLVCGGVNNRKQ